MQYHYDVLIVGGGLTGNSLALALRDSGLKVAIVEANTRQQLLAAPTGDRALALAAGTVAKLENLGLWQGVSDSATAIKQIHISDQGHFGKVRLSAEKEKVDALGYVIEARTIEAHLAEQVDQSGIEQLCPARVVAITTGQDHVNVSLKLHKESIIATAKLVVGADGGNSSVRNLLEIPQQRTDYEQTALVTTVKSSLPNQNVAYERFTSSGPLALLPVDKTHSAVVWTRTNADADALMEGSEADFLAQLQDCFGYKLGELSLTAPRRAFPLSLIRAEQMLAERTVIIGNAAHQLHPVAGQGFNLGLRDVVDLAEMLINRQQQALDIGSADFLHSFAKIRLQDQNRTISFTDNVVRIFSNDWLALAAARNLGLSLLDHIPAAKSLLARYAMGLAGGNR